MSESDKTFDEIGKHQDALYNAIVANARSIALAIVTGTKTQVDGKFWIPKEYLILKEINEEVKKKLQS